MLARILFAVASRGSVVFAGDARAAGEAPIEEHRRTPTPFDGIGPNLVDAFSGANLYLYAGAIASTAAMVTSGVDQEIRLYTQQHLVVRAYGQASVLGGYVLPAVVAPAIYLIGLLEDDPKLAAAGAATVQTLAVTVVATSLLKWTTGRPFPTHGADPNDPAKLAHPEYAREFHPFNFNRAWAWPSGHTSATISVAASLTAFYPEHPWIPAVGYPLSLAIGIGMINGDHHWGSDVVAGALLGHAVGYTIGRNFRRMLREAERKGDHVTWDHVTWELAPMAGSATGLAVRGEF